jgi:predicted phosphodiesterase
VNLLRVIGDVHAQTDEENLVSRLGRPYLELIAGVEASVQLGDMGDGETYDQLRREVDVERHRFFPGNHDHYDRFPPHNLGDFGPAALGGVKFFFVRGAESTDRDKLVRLGLELGKTLWFAEEQLTDEQMQAGERAYAAARPTIVITHDAPTAVARVAWENSLRHARRDAAAVFRPSRTNEFLTRLFERHAPRLWLFGHHHRDLEHRVGDTWFRCVGELSYVDITAEGLISDVARR